MDGIHTCVGVGKVSVTRCEPGGAPPAPPWVVTYLAEQQ